MTHHNTAHGHAKPPSRTYKVWRKLKDRCLNPNIKEYANFGARGVKVCDRWLSFANFLEDVGEIPEGVRVALIDRTGNYEPGNVRLVLTHHNTKHGHWKDNKPSKTYQAWRAIKSRCLNPNVKAFPDYGGRGIKVCDRWLSFENFLEDVGEIPEGLSIDRIDNDGNYEPGNVRLVSMQIQANNRRTTRTLTVNGITKTVAEWTKETGLSKSTIHNRIRAGWPDHKCIEPTS